MTKLMKGLFAMGVAAVLTGAATAAQAADLKGTIPFGFTVNSRALPAGVYHVEISQGVLTVRGANDGAVVLTTRTESTSDRTSKLVFYKVGDTYELREAWTAGYGRKVPGPRTEPRRGERTADVERVEITLS